MNNDIVNKKACKLIETAKKFSKNRFLLFARRFYGTDQELWDHLWKIPIVPTYKNEIIFPAKLESISRDNMLDLLNDIIESQIGTEEAAFIPYETILTEFPKTLSEEYTKKVESGIIDEKYNAAIVYNEKALQMELQSIIKERYYYDPPLTTDKICDIFLNIVSEIFLHELVHLNAQSLIIDETNPNNSIVLNGAHLDGYKYTVEKNIENNNDNEVLVDTLAILINISSRIDTIEDGLYEIVKKRNGSSNYENFDDRTALLIFTLFPDELSKWLMFEAYDDHHHNLYEEKYNEVFGGMDESSISEKLKKAGEYFNTISSSINISQNKLQKRKEILEMLGVKNINLQQSQNTNFPKLKNSNCESHKPSEDTSLDER